ncbi:hypothetical protein WCLP8_1770003 [uncultured Gammaproteobacteria bacterium]
MTPLGDPPLFLGFLHGVSFYLEHQQDGYRRLTFMMLDACIVAVSPARQHCLPGLRQKDENAQAPHRN